MSQIVTIAKAAELAGVSMSSIRYHIRQGHIEVQRRAVEQKIIHIRKEMQDHVDLDQVKQLVKKGRHR